MIGVGAAVLGMAAVDLLTGGRLLRRGGGREGNPRDEGGLRERLFGGRRPISVQRSVTVRCSPEDAYGFWRNFENLPRCMSHLESVQRLDERRSRWVARGPAGSTVEWVAEIVDDQPGRRIAWRSIDLPGKGATVENRGSVRFVPTPGDRGTEVHVWLEYSPPAGALGAAVAKLLGEEPSVQISSDLHRFKQVMEVGEVVQSDASIHRGMHPAQPA